MPGETARDPRRSTFLKVHIRADTGWSEAIVCNVSGHGMMLRGEDLPRRGSFIEIASGTVAVAGQVRWSLAGRCGVRTREAVDLATLLGEPAGDDHLAAPPAASRRQGSSPRARPAADGKAMARALDLALTLTLLIAGAGLIGTAVTEMLGKPLDRIGSELRPARP